MSAQSSKFDLVGLRRRAIASVALAVVWSVLVVVWRPDSAAAAPGGVCVSEQPDEVSARATAAACGFRVEVLSARSERSQVFANPAGSLTLEAAAMAQRVRRADNSWEDIDLSLIWSAGMLTPVAALADVRFSGGGSGPLVSTGAGWSLVWPGALPTPRVDGDSAVYPAVWPGVDLVVRATEAGFRPVLVVHSAAAAANSQLASVRLSVVGASVVTGEDGSMSIVDASGVAVGSVGAGSMWDSSAVPGRPGEVRGGATTPGSAAELASDMRGPGAAAATSPVAIRADGSDLLLAPDLTWLRASERVFPVHVDPQVDLPKTKWAYANSINSNWDVNGEAWVGRNPYDDTLYRSFFDFDVTSLQGVNVLTATVKMKLDHSWSCSPTWVSLSRTGSITVSNGARMSWGTRPLPGTGQAYLGAEAANANEAGGCGYIQDDADVVFDSSAVTTDVQYAADNNWSGYTVGLCACNSAGEYEDVQDRWKRFFVGHTYLVVDYNSYPNTAIGMATQLPSGCLATSSGSDTEPLPRVNPDNAGDGLVLKAAVSDPDGGTVRGQFEWWPKATKGVSGRIGVFTTASPGVASGSYVQATVASGTFSNDVAYSWRVRGYDGTDYSKSWSPWCEFVADTGAPGEPDVTSTELPEFPATPPASAVEGRPATVTFTPAGGTDAQIAGYIYGIADTSPTPTLYAPAESDGTATVRVTPPAGASVKALTVQAIDRAGNRSALPELGYSYRFRVSSTTTSLAGWWPTIGTGSPIVDASAAGNDMSLGGGSSLGYGTASFTGTGYATTANQVLATDASFTAAAWVRVTDGSDWRAIVSQAGVVASGFYLQYQPGTGKFRFALPTTDTSNPTLIEALSTGAATLGTWYHIAGVYDSGAGQIRLYVNGGLSGSASYAGPHWAATGPLQVGRTKWQTYQVNHMVGDIADVRSWQGALDGAGVAALATQPPLAGAWGMHDPGSAPAIDVSGLANAHNAGLFGGSGWSPGKTGTGLQVNGSNGYAATAGAVVRTDGSFTVAAWVYMTDTSSSTYRTAVSQDGTNASGFFLMKTQDRWTFTRITSDSTSTVIVRAYSSALFTPNTWVHLAGVYNANASQIQLYVNGILNATATCSGCGWNATGPLAIGRSKWGGFADWWSGGIDDVRVYQGALGSAQITGLAAG